jgi:hypothetical protein
MLHGLNNTLCTWSISYEQRFDVFVQLHNRVERAYQRSVHVHTRAKRAYLGVVHVHNIRERSFDQAEPVKVSLESG